jgi:hypothetical protein
MPVRSDDAESASSAPEKKKNEGKRYNKTKSNTRRMKISR